MEDLLIAMLFIYPGALVELFNRTFRRDWHTITNVPSYVILAKYLVVSVVITGGSLIVFAMTAVPLNNGFSDIKDILFTGWNIAYYLSISFISTIVFSMAWWWVSDVVKRLGKRLYDFLRIPWFTSGRKVWDDFIDDEDILDSVITIHEKDELKNAGFIRSFPTEISTDKAISLKNTECVLMQLDAEKNNPTNKRHIAYVKAEYVDLATNKVIRIWETSAAFVAFAKGRPLTSSKVEAGEPTAEA